MLMLFRALSKILWTNLRSMRLSVHASSMMSLEEHNDPIDTELTKHLVGSDFFTDHSQ
jgi:hypothetical protein